MHKYWIKFDVKFGQKTYGVQLGCGVTAENIELAKKMAEHIVFRGDPMPVILSIVEDVDLAHLDQKHVIPNIAYPDRAGVWFPAYKNGQDPKVLDEIRRK